MERLLKDRYLFLFSVGCFFLSLIFGLGLVLSADVNEAISNNNNYYTKREGISGATFFFIQNFKVVLMLLSGIFCFGLSTFLVLVINGFWLGGVIASQYLNGTSVWELCISILPHGIFEIPALLLAGYIGFVGFKFYFQKKNWKRNLSTVGIIVVLLLIAYFIEGFVTPKYI
ncbi:stage II sporulation protein M [Priestia flexa]|nr:stage II sporulation protein M [Priestia flexa]